MCCHGGWSPVYTCGSFDQLIGFIRVNKVIIIIIIIIIIIMVEEVKVSA